MTWSSLRYLPGQIALALAIFGLWEILVKAGVLSAHLYGYPSGIAARIVALVASGELFVHAGVTAFAAIMGFALGSLIGSFAGLCLWLNETVARTVRPFIVAINGVPKIAFAPLIIVWFGIGIESKIAIAAALTFIVSLIATYNGTLETDKDLLRLMRSLGATRLQAWRKVVIPAALPWILSTLRLNVGFALIGAVVGEYISSQQGLGYLVYYSGVLYDLNGVWAGIIALMVVALLMGRGVTEIDRRLANLRERAEQLPAEAGAAVLRLYVEVLEVDAVGAAPGGEVEEPQRHADDAALDLGDVAVQGGGVAEQAGGELLLGEPDLVQRLLVVGQLAHQPDHRGDVLRADRPHAHDGSDSLPRDAPLLGRRRSLRCSRPCPLMTGPP